MINIIHTPPKFTPVFTDGLFYTISADTNYFKFRYTYDVLVNNQIIFNGKATPNPFGLGVIDVSQILKTHCENIPISNWNTTPIYTHQTFPFSRPYADEVVNYQVNFGYEYATDALAPVTGFTGNGVDTGPPSVSIGIYKVFSSTMGVNGRATQQDFNIEPFILSGTPTGTDPTTSGLFLTNSPRNRNIQPEQYYTLAFTNWYLDDLGNELSEPYFVKYTFYDDQGAVITATTYDNITTNGGGPRTGCTEIYQTLGTTIYEAQWNTLYVGAGPGNIPYFPSNCVQYTVQLFGASGDPAPPPSPTPSMTPTPSPTPGCALCYDYQIQNTSLISGVEVSYVSCGTNLRITTIIAPDSTLEVCACFNSVDAPEDVIVTQGDLCGEITPTPTPTLTRTPTQTPTSSGLPPTPTPTPCSCVTYTVTNTEDSETTVGFTDCNTGTFTSQVIEASAEVEICSCSIPESIPPGRIEYVVGGPCLPG
jgi:hypothetical protein